MRIYLDTHAIVFLHDGQHQKFSDRCKKLINEGDLFIAPIVKLELKYLFEIKRVKFKPDTIFQHLYQIIDLNIDETSLATIVDIAVDLDWTRDPFDRLIVAYAKAADAHLVSLDQQIIQHYPKVLN